MDDYMAIDEASISINYTKGVAWSLIDPDKGLGSMQFKVTIKYSPSHKTLPKSD